MPSKYVDIAGIAINYFHAGQTTLPDVPPDLRQGEMMLFVHGAGSNAHTWHRQLDHFGRHHSAVAFDFPAHGRSGNTEGLTTIDAWVQCTKAFADALQLRRFVLTGHGSGGAVALQFVLEDPDRVRALVLAATPAKFELSQESLDTWYDVMRGRKPQPFSTTLFSPRADFAVVREGWMEQVQTDPRVRYTDMLACNGLDFTARLAKISVPTLVITGSDDCVVPPAKAAELQRKIPDARLVVIQHAGHMLAAEQPEAFNRTVDNFVATLGK